MTEPSDAPRAEGIGQSVDALFAEVYARLKALASRRLARQPGATLDTTALVHELYLRMGTDSSLRFAESVQFFAYAARAMRHLLLDRARNRMRLRAGGEWRGVTLNEELQLTLDSAEESLALEGALGKLELSDARAARVVELRYFAGLSVEQIAQVMHIAPRTVDREWRFARARLHELLGGPG
jgi:RNA polymerase sigma factor (TIGR02999 family)